MNCWRINAFGIELDVEGILEPADTSVGWPGSFEFHSVRIPGADDDIYELLSDEVVDTIQTYIVEQEADSLNTGE